MKESDSLKNELWNSFMENYFDGPDDPNYIVLEITPERIALMNKTGREPEILDV